MAAALRAHTHTAEPKSMGADEWRFVHEWFAGWRWERHRAGALVDESLQNFETPEECAADANRHGRAAPKKANVVPLAPAKVER